MPVIRHPSSEPGTAIPSYGTFSHITGFTLRATRNILSGQRDEVLAATSTDLRQVAPE